MKSNSFCGAWRRSFRNIAAASLCMLALFACKEKHPAVVETPVFDVWSTSALEIEKIEMSDSATVLHIHVFFEPNHRIRMSGEAFIRESGTDEKLAVVKADGLELDENIVVPESGEFSFKLYFPPLKPEVTKIDFIECESEGCFNIWGIHLMPGAKVKVESSLSQKECTQPLPAIEYSTEPAKLSGKYFGYSKTMNKEISVNYSDFSGQNQSVKATVADDGSFSLEVPVGFPGIYNSSLGRIFLTPGQEVKWYVDLVKQTRNDSRLRKDKNSGDSINEFTEGSGFFISKAAIRKAGNIAKQKNLKDYNAFATEVFGMKPSEYKDFIINKYTEKLNEVKQSGDSETVKILSEAFLKQSTLHDLIRYENYMFNGYTLVHHIDRQRWDTITYQPERPDKAYYASAIKNLFSDRLAYVPDFSIAVSLLKYGYLPEDAGNKTVLESFAAFKENVKPVLGETNMAYDYVLATLYNRQMETSFFTDAEKEEIKAAFTNPAYTETLIAENDKIQAMSEANKSLIKPIPNVAEDKVFDEIIKQYKGKVVLVDFWATWCGPCKQALKTMTPLKESWKDKNIVFVYLTGETSPMAAYNKMIPDIHGEHYRVSDKQWAYWYKSMSIEGVPTYMIYDKEGKQVKRFTGYPGNNEMQKVIEPLF